MGASTGILSDSDRLLLLAVRDASTRGEDAARILAQRTVVWEDLERHSTTNRVDAFVANLLAHPCVRPHVDAGRAADWRARQMLGVFRMGMAQQRVRDLGEAMRAVGIDMLAYKGIDFQLRCYSGDRPRGFSDIDVLVARDQVERADAALRAAGCLRSDREKSLGYYRRFHLHAVYGHLRYPWPIELHWAIDAFAGAVDPAARILSAATAGPELGPGVLRPSPIDALALMCLHLDKHLGRIAWLPDPHARLKAVIQESGLVWLLDVVRWLQRQAQGHSAEEILRRMRELGAERSLIVALRLAGDLEPTALPSWARQQAARMPPRVPWVVRLLHPDLVRGRPLDAASERRRKRLYTMSRRWGFRPIRILQLVLPSGRIPVRSPVAVPVRVLWAVRRAGLLVANGWYLAQTLARERRRRLSRIRAPS